MALRPLPNQSNETTQLTGNAANNLQNQTSVVAPSPQLLAGPSFDTSLPVNDLFGTNPTLLSSLPAISNLALQNLSSTETTTTTNTTKRTPRSSEKTRGITKENLILGYYFPYKTTR